LTPTEAICSPSHPPWALPRQAPWLSQPPPSPVPTPIQSQQIKDCAAWWKQRGKCRALTEGDANTRYFHARASGRLRHNRIQLLEVDGVELFAHDDKVAAITAYYTGILGHQAVTSWTFSLEEIYADRAKAEAQALTAPFTDAEAWAAVKSMNSSSAPGPDGIGPSFYEAAWRTVGRDVMAFLHAFHASRVDIQRINRAYIVLIPKCPAATTPSSFTPVSLRNCPVKILTKVLTARLQAQIQKLVDIDQTGFLKGRSIAENFVYATELVQCCYKRKAPTVVLKLDFAKAFDSVDWAGLMSVLQTRGFPLQWCDWMLQLLRSSRSAVLVNASMVVPGHGSRANGGCVKGSLISVPVLTGCRRLAIHDQEGRGLDTTPPDRQCVPRPSVCGRHADSGEGSRGRCWSFEAMS